jgi:hypothetical protein
MAAAVQEGIENSGNIISCTSVGSGAVQAWWHAPWRGALMPPAPPWMDRLRETRHTCMKREEVKMRSDGM